MPQKYIIEEVANLLSQTISCGESVPFRVNEEVDRTLHWLVYQPEVVDQVEIENLWFCNKVGVKHDVVLRLEGSLETVGCHPTCDVEDTQYLVNRNQVSKCIILHNIKRKRDPLNEATVNSEVRLQVVKCSCRLQAQTLEVVDTYDHLSRFCNVGTIKRTKSEVHET